MDALLAHLPPKLAAHLSNKGYIYAAPDNLAALVDVSKPSLWIAVGSVLFNPIYWNIVARNEYRKRTLTKALGSPYNACYFLAVTIFSLGILRDHLYQAALKDQPHLKVLADPAFKALAVGLFLAGQVFVVTSMWALGVTGTYLGDYCGILMKERVTCFPFNVLNDPMYVGSAMAFLGTAIWYESPAGIAISALVWIVYSVALKYEGPFTDMIYTTAAKAADKKAASVEAPAPHPAAVPEAPQTPRKPRAAKTESATATSTAAATGTQTPRRRSSRKSVLVQQDGAAVPTASPMRVTRSRSRARQSDADDTD